MTIQTFSSYENRTNIPLLCNSQTFYTKAKVVDEIIFFGRTNFVVTMITGDACGLVGTCTYNMPSF